MAYQQIKTIVALMKQGADVAQGIAEIALLADAPGGLHGRLRVAGCRSLAEHEGLLISVAA